MEQTTEVNEVVAEVMNTINILGAFIELTEDQITIDAVKEKLHSMKAWKLIEKLNTDMQRLAFEAIQNGTSKFSDIEDKLRIIEQDQERKMVSPTTGSLTEKMGLIDIGFRAFVTLQESISGVSEPNLIELQQEFDTSRIDWTKITKEGDMEKFINKLEEQRTLLEHVIAGVASLDPEYGDYPPPAAYVLQDEDDAEIQRCTRVWRSFIYKDPGGYRRGPEEGKRRRNKSGRGERIERQVSGTCTSVKGHRPRNERE